MTRHERRHLRALADDLRDSPDGLAARLRPPRWWESASFARAMCSTMLFGVAVVSRELCVDTRSLPRDPLAG